MTKAAVPSILVAVVLLALGVTGEAQQPKKVPRIGFLGSTPLSAISSRVEAFSHGLRELGTWRERILSLSGNTQREN